MEFRVHIARMLKVHRPFAPEVSRCDAANRKVGSKAPRRLRKKGEKECEEISLRYRNEKSLSMKLFCLALFLQFQVCIHIKFHWIFNLGHTEWIAPLDCKQRNEAKSGSLKAVEGIKQTLREQNKHKIVFKWKIDKLNYNIATLKCDVYQLIRKPFISER